jgi:hypothetical protein
MSKTRTLFRGTVPLTIGEADFLNSFIGTKKEPAEVILRYFYLIHFSKF